MGGGFAINEELAAGVIQMQTKMTKMERIVYGEGGGDNNDEEVKQKVILGKTQARTFRNFPPAEYLWMISSKYRLSDE